jgi:signal transduction histidine kinase
VTLFWKGILLAVIPSIFEIIALFFLLSAQHDAGVADAWALHSADVLDSSSALYEPVLAEAVRFRGAILQDRPSMADDQFWSLLDAQAGRLADEVRDNPSQQQRAKAIQDDIRRYRQALGRTYAIAVNGGLEAIRTRYRPGGGVEVLDQISAEFGKFQHEERRLDSERKAAARVAREHQQYAIYVIILLSMVVGFFAAYLFNRSVGFRLATITRNASRMGSGEPLEPLVAGHDEITTVDLALHRAADEIAAKRAFQASAERQLAERADALLAANEDLRQQRQDNEMFIYSVSHDLRSPLVNLEGFSKELGYSSQELKGRIAKIEEPARTDLQKLLEVDFEPALRYVSAAVTQASRIIDALLKLSRVGRIELREENIDVNAMVALLLDAVAQTVRAASAKITVGDLPPMYGDAAAIGQVFANLINNALYYRDPERPLEIEIGGTRDADSVSYFIKDTGLGMTGQQQTKLFVAFKRFHPQAAKGEGIGLAYVKRVIDRHSGKIAVKSAEQQGSTFTLQFPNRAIKEET